MRGGLETHPRNNSAKLTLSLQAKQQSVMQQMIAHLCQKQYMEICIFIVSINNDACR